MSWGLLFIAGLFEVAMAIGLKYSHGFSRFWPSVATLVAMAAAMGLLALAMKALPAGTAYSVWVGIGTVGTVLVGAALLGEPLTPARLASIALIIAGVIGLRLSEG